MVRSGKVNLSGLYPGRNVNLPTSLQSKLEADDLVQEISVHACRGWNRLPCVTIAGFRGWLVVIGKGCIAVACEFYIEATCRDLAREEPFDERPVDYGEQRPSHVRDLDDDCRGSDLIKQLRQALADLPTDERMLIDWRFVERRSLEHIARHLNCAPSTARVSCQHAVTALRSKLTKACNRPQLKAEAVALQRATPSTSATPTKLSAKFDTLRKITESQHVSSQ